MKIWSRKNVSVNVKPQAHNLAYNLDQDAWVIITLATNKMQIQWLTETHCIHIRSPLHKVNTPDSGSM